MSVPLREEKRSEAPLITFTLCVPAAVGMVVLSALFELFAWAGGTRGMLLHPNPLLLLAGGSALLLTIIGMLASMVHLAKPMCAPFSLRHLRSSWLSREIAAVGLFWACVAVWFVGAVLDNAPCASVALLCAAISGIALLFVIARAYKVSTRPAWLGNECLMELVASACGAGAAAFLLCLSVSAGIGFGGTGQEAFTWGGLDVVACLVLSCVLLVAGALLGPYAHRARYQRLLSLREASDERVALTLENYASLRPVVRRAARIEVIAVIVGIIGSCLFVVGLDSDTSSITLIAGAITLCSLATVLEFVAHGMQRWLFYEIPVPVRYIALLRK